MNTDEYRIYLAQPHWQDTKAAALRARGHRCEACGSTHKLHVHHRTYQRLGHEELTDLRVLCHDCHDLVHDSRTQRSVSLPEATDLVTSIRHIDPDQPVDVRDVLPTVIDLLAIRSHNITRP